MRTTESQVHTRTGLAEIAWKSMQNPHQEFHSLMHHFDESGLRDCFNKLDGRKAIGVDGIDKAEYRKNLTANLQGLVVRLKQMAYRPGAVREVHIPKEGKRGASRPLGISNFEDKLVQKRMQELLESIYEPIFKDFSHGFRPKRGCHGAIKELMHYLYKEEVEVIIDVDLANFFNTIDHEVAKELIGKKIKDKKFIRYLMRMFKSEILSSEGLRVSEEGVTQGSCCSPVIANIVAHYVIDEWMDETVTPLMRGKVKMVRYADDMVICCRYEEDALRIRKVLGKRLAKYRLQLNEEKTKMVPFSKAQRQKGVKQGTFDFLGFQIYLGKTKSGNKIIPKLKTGGKRFRGKLVRVKEWIKGLRNRKPLGELWITFCSKLKGHIQYFGVSFNYEKVALFIHEAKKIIFKWLNRRSQRKSFSWDKFELFLKRHPLPKVEIIHRLF
tara:strand:+ start:483 stop:1802 length:1320 start_codon:yes stop_codon:yes gene_type:complete